MVNSHGHYDHFGGNYQFTDIYMSKKDYALFDYYKPMLGELNNSNGINISNILNSISQKEHYKNIDPDYIFDLGGVILTVVNLEGHTAGSIGLYYQKRKLLLVGDAISPQMCIFFPESLPLSTLKNTFKAAWNYDFHFMLLSHFPEKYPKSIIKEFEKCFTLIPHSKHYDYSYSLFSCMKGSLYIQEINNSEINQMICIITKTNPI